MIGQAVGRYKILSKIGVGAMGSVWKAEDPLLGRVIALKFLPESLASSPEARKRFLREAQAASVLAHPGIATVFDTGESDGRIYIALQLVDGKTIRERISAGTVPVEDALQIGIETCDALAHAHSKGILHRDVTSGNIMVTKDGRVVIVDFGLALPEGATRLTQTGVAVGTAAYMAPEVFRGEKPDRRADIYGAGAVLYELLTGRVPFEADRREALAFKALNEEPLPPGTHRAEVPLELDAIVLKALAKDPADRYQNATKFADDLNALVRGDARAISATRKTSRLTRFRRKVKRATQHRFFWPAIIALLAIAGGTLWKTGILPFAGSQAFASVAVLPFENLSASPSESAWLALGISRSLATKLTQLSDMTVAPWVTTRRFNDLSRPLIEIAQELRVDALVIGQLNVVGDHIQVTVSLIDGRSGHQVWAYEISEKVDDVLDAESAIAVETAKRLKGRISGGEVATLAVAPTQSVDAYKHYLEGALLLDDGDRRGVDRAEAFFEKALQLDPGLTDALVGMGSVNHNRWFYGWGGGARNLEMAEVYYNRALEEDARNYNARRGLARVYWEQGRSEDCLKIGRAAATWIAEDSPEALMVLADSYFFGGLAEKAMPILDRVIELDPANPDAHWLKPLAHVWLGQSELVIEAGERYLDKFGEDAELYLHMAIAYEILGDFDIGRVYRARVRKLAPSRWGTNFYYFAEPDESQGSDDLMTEIRLIRHRLNAYPDHWGQRAVLATAYGYAGNREMLESEESRVLEQAYPGVYLGALAMAHVSLGEHRRAFELLELGVERGTDNLQVLIELNFLQLEGIPGFDECYADMKALHERNLAEY